MSQRVLSSVQSSVDAAAIECLKRAQISGPPVDAFKLARRLEIDVVVDAGQTSRGRLARVGGRPAIFIQPDDRLERQQWAVAHELGEALAHEACCEGAPDDLGASDREQLANLLATRLLLPADWFAHDARRLDCDLLQLKSLYETASHELIAWRLLDLHEPCVVTVFDQGRATRRRSNASDRAPPIDRRELGCWQEAHRFSRALDRRSDPLRVQAWPVHEPGWRREILRTTSLATDD
ncbi:MAG: ImmA/IrrE family metallo-endopeptidase [Planctomycetaceae bacterium]